MIPNYWKDFVESEDIVGVDFEIDEKSDLSELGGDLRIMTSEQCIDEGLNCYPGILAAKSGYVPVGMCLEGSGDYYYINREDGALGPLYRIYHDAIENEEIRRDGIQKVLDNYESLLSLRSA